tara:strand:+ start:222 stop:833 length:612 start_codon:yes stop_codon:yes gene_type:complete
MQKNIFIVFGHHNTQTSFNAAIRDTFIEEALRLGHNVDLVNLFEEREKLPFYDGDTDPMPDLVLDYQRRLESSDVLFLIGSCHNLRLNSILENWIDWVLHPPWFFNYRSIFPQSKFFKNYGYPISGALKGKLGIVSITYGGPMVTYFNFSLFDNIPYRRIKKSVFKLGGLRTKYLRFYSVLPNMSEKDFTDHMRKVRTLAASF